MTTGHASWAEHQHDAVGHEHPHYHVTHNFIERVGGFEHLGYQHTHEHAHATESHSHYPHEDFATEHLGGGARARACAGRRSVGVDGSEGHQEGIEEGC